MGSLVFYVGEVQAYAGEGCMRDWDFIEVKIEFNKVLLPHAIFNRREAGSSL